MVNTSQPNTPRNNTPSQTPCINSNSVHAQRQRLLARLKIAPVDTLTARRELDILCPAARVLELRRRGYPIEAVWVNRETDCGKLHRVALYILRTGEMFNEQLELLIPSCAISAAW